MLITLYRTFKEALNNFWRNGWLTVAAVTILVSSLYLIGTLYVVVSNAGDNIKAIQEKESVGIYFKSDVVQEDITKMKNELSRFKEIKSVEYISKEQALEDFKKNNANEPAILQALDEIGENPLLDALIVKAADPAQYEMIVGYINGSKYSNDISRINFEKNRQMIEEITRSADQTKKVGWVLGVLVMAISLLIIFNTVRITIYTHRKEIEIMRLVGASNTFIRLPFIFEGVIYGIGSSIIAVLMLFVTWKFIAPSGGSHSVLPNSLFNIGATFYFSSHFWSIFGLQLLIGIGLGTISSWVAMRKYLKI